MDSNNTSLFGLTSKETQTLGEEESRRLLNNKKLGNLSSENRKDILKHLNVTKSFKIVKWHVPENVTCFCDLCEKKFCITKSGCFSTIIYATKTGTLAVESNGCLNDDTVSKV